MNVGLVVPIYHTPIVLFLVLVVNCCFIWWWWCSGGGDGCCKGCNSDCCSIAILKCIFSESFGCASGSEGVVVVVVVVVIGYWW